MFRDVGFGVNFLSNLITVIASTIMAPVVEEIVYRGVMFRSLHDGLLRKLPRQRSIFGLPAIVATTVTAISFILPHVSELQVNWTTVAYFISSAGFGLVYLLTGSMLAAMVSHSLQSLYAFGNILLFGRGDYALSPIIWVIVFGCPIWVWLIGKLIEQFIPRGSETHPSAL